MDRTLDYESKNASSILVGHSKNIMAQCNIQTSRTLNTDVLFSINLSHANYLANAGGYPYFIFYGEVYIATSNGSKIYEPIKTGFKKEDLVETYDFITYSGEE